MSLGATAIKSGDARLETRGGGRRQSGSVRVVLVGPHGVGKTLLAQLAAEQVMSEDGRSGRARWVVGTAPGRAIPFGAFRHLISLPASGADIGRPAALLRAARSS